MYRKLLRRGLLLCAAALLLTGCRVRITVGSRDTLTGETYPDAERYQTGACAYAADAVTAVEVYWRSGAVELAESDGPELHAQESGEDLPEDAAMHWLLDGSVLRIRFCASGADITVDPSDKELRLEVPEGIDISIHTTAAPVRAETLAPHSLVIAAMSGDTALGAVTADTVDLSSSAGAIQADRIAARTIRCSAVSGSIALGDAEARTLDCTASSGSVTLGGGRAETIRVTTASGSAGLALGGAETAQICTTSGAVTLTPGPGGAEVLYTTSGGGSLRTELPYTRKGDLYVFGEGACAVTVETSSGTLELQEGESE